MNLFKFTKMALIFVASTISVYAQKQPQIQQISVRAPDHIKIDGKLNEWPNINLNAYNPANRIFYVVSNDDDNLYFAVRGLGNGVAKKALAGGMVITINKTADSKKDKVVISYPLPQDSKIVLSIMGIINQISSYDDLVASHKEIDSIVAVANQYADNTIKDIGLSGVKDIRETTVSKYNEFGIKAAFQFIKMQPVIEIAIPLKYLGLSVTDPFILRYNIKLNQIPEESTVVTQPLPDNLNPNIGFALNPTDFGGEYTLAKKKP